MTCVWVYAEEKIDGGLEFEYLGHLEWLVHFGANGMSREDVQARSNLVQC